jgi:hypothetical protein
MAQNNFTSIKPSVESEPIQTKSEQSEIQEVVEHEQDVEIKPFVQKRKENIKLPADIEKIGVTTTHTTQFPSYQSVTTPLSDDKVLTGLHAPITSSFRWLAVLAMYILRHAHLTLKKIHGKIVRIKT